MNSKMIGNVGEAKVLCKFVELGIPVYQSFGDNEKADLIAEFNGKLNKIQVKTSLKAENGAVKFDLTSSTVHRKNGVKHKYTTSEIDYFACYNIERDKIYLIKVTNEPRSTITIRYITAAATNSNINYEEEFLIENVLSNYKNIKDKEDEYVKEIVRIENYCIDCGTPISSDSTRCIRCTNKQRIIPLDQMPVTREELKDMIRTLPFTTIGTKFEVKDNTIRKWCVKFNLPRTKKEINSYSDEEWEAI